MARTTWQNVKSRPYPRLRKNISVDVAIVGGGLTGITTAHLLSKEGLRVALFEKDRIGSGVTAYTTAFITQSIDTDLPQLVSMFGDKKAKLVWESGRAAIETIDHIQASEGVECEFVRCSHFTYATREKDLEELGVELNAARSAGFKNIELDSVHSLGFPQVGFLELKDQAKFHPLKFLFGVAKKAKENGILIFEKTEILNIGEKNPFVLKTKKQKISAKNVIVTTYDPFNNPQPVQFKKGMYVSYIYEIAIEKNVLREGMYADLHNPYHYFRIDRGSKHDRMIVGGEDHRSELKIAPEKNFAALRSFVNGVLPNRNYKILRKWPGPILEPIDGLALIGKVAPHHFVATAFSGTGMTYAVISAILFRDLIVGRKNAWKNLYDPKRTPTVYHLWKKRLDYTGEFFGAATKNIFRSKANRK